MTQQNWNLLDKFYRSCHGNKNGGLKFCFDSFHQISWNFVGISTVVCGSFWGVVAMVTKVQKMLNSLRTVDPFETWQKNSSSLKVVLFVFKIFKMAANIQILKIVINSKNRFQWKWIFTGSKTCWPYGNHFSLLWWPSWTKNGCQDTKILQFGRNLVSK